MSEGLLRPPRAGRGVVFPIRVPAEGAATVFDRSRREELDRLWLKAGSIGEHDLGEGGQVADRAEQTGVPGDAVHESRGRVVDDALARRISAGRRATVARCLTGPKTGLRQAQFITQID